MPSTPSTGPATTSRVLSGPSFAQPEATADPTTFVVKHASDAAAYKAIDELNAEHKIVALPFPAPSGGTEPRLTFDQVVANTTTSANILAAKQIVFHATGDCGSTSGPRTQNEVTDKMVADFQESDPSEVPQFNFLLGDIVYSFGETQYYYDQFYEPYRNYPAPILAAAGNHDGMISPLAHATSLAAFLRNFCANAFEITPEAGGLSRTAQIQPGVFFTFEAPFVRILTLYSNTLEDPGVIANATIGNTQLAYLAAALARVKREKFAGALLVVHHHPGYTVGSGHGWSIEMQAQLDAAFAKAGVWPHAALAGHAHNYQRFTRTRPDGTQIPFIVCGNGGHALQKLADAKTPLRTPQVIQAADATHDRIVFENYDDTNYGYLRVIANAQQLRIEYHPASDGAGAKTPDDFVTVDIASRKLVQYNARDLGRAKATAAVRSQRAASVAAAPRAKKAGGAKRGQAAKKSSSVKGAGRRGRRTVWCISVAALVLTFFTCKGVVFADVPAAPLDCGSDWSCFESALSRAQPASVTRTVTTNENGMTEATSYAFELDSIAPPGAVLTVGITADRVTYGTTLVAQLQASHLTAAQIQAKEAQDEHASGTGLESTCTFQLAPLRNLLQDVDSMGGVSPFSFYAADSCRGPLLQSSMQVRTAAMPAPTDVVAPPGYIDCGPSLGCLVRALGQGEPASGWTAASLSLFGVDVSSATLLRASDFGGDEVTFYDKTLKDEATLDPALIAQLKAQGHSAKEIADAQQQAEETAHKTVGLDATCRFQTTLLEGLLRRWYSGQYSSGDFGNAEHCSGTMFGPQTPSPNVSPTS